jgi:hypothetical protein
MKKGDLRVRPPKIALIISGDGRMGRYKYNKTALDDSAATPVFNFGAFYDHSFRERGLSCAL